MIFWKKKNPKGEPSRSSPQKLQELVDEHSLVTQSLARMRVARGRQIMHGVGQDVTTAVYSNLLARRLELELMIDVLTDNS